MSKENSRYTLLIVPSSSSEVRQVSFHRNFLYGAGSVAIALALLTSYGLVRLHYLYGKGKNGKGQCLCRDQS